MSTEYVDKKHDILLDKRGLVIKREIWMSMNNDQPDAVVAVDYFFGFVVGIASKPLYLDSLEYIRQQLNECGVSDDVYLNRVLPILLPESFDKY